MTRTRCCPVPVMNVAQLDGNASSSQCGVHSPTSWPSAARASAPARAAAAGSASTGIPNGAPRQRRDAEPARIGARRVRERGGRGRGVVAVARLIPGDRVEGDGGVEHGAGEDAVHGHAAAEVAEVRADRDPAEAGLQADQAAARRRDADRPAEVAGVGERDHPRGDCGRAPARRATGRELRVPRVPRRAVPGVLGDRPHADLRRVRLADDDRARVAEAAHMGAVVVGHPVAEGRASLRGRNPLGGGEQVLDADRDPAERARIAWAYGVRLGQGALGAHEDERVQARGSCARSPAVTPRPARVPRARRTARAPPDRRLGAGGRHARSSRPPNPTDPPTDRAVRPRGRDRAARAASRCRRSRRRYGATAARRARPRGAGA